MNKAAGKNQISVSNNAGDLFIDVDWLFFSVRALTARRAKCQFVVLKRKKENAKWVSLPWNFEHCIQSIHWNCWKSLTLAEPYSLLYYARVFKALEKNVRKWQWWTLKWHYHKLLVTSSPGSHQLSHHTTVTTPFSNILPASHLQLIPNQHTCLHSPHHLPYISSHPSLPYCLVLLLLLQVTYMARLHAFPQLSSVFGHLHLFPARKMDKE